MLQLGGRRAFKLTLIAFAILCLGLLTILAGNAPAQMASIQQWTKTTDYPLSLAVHSAIVHDNHIFVIGGSPTAGVAEARGFSAKINVDGSLEAWMPLTSLPGGLYLHAVAKSATHLYVIGGWNGSDTRYDVLSAPFMTDGAIGEWSKVGEYPTFPEGVTLHDAVAVGNTLYVTGGRNGFDSLDRVYYASIVNGQLGTWQQGPLLPESRYRHRVLATDTHIYVVGGAIQVNNQAVARNTVFYAKIQNNGSLGAWTATTALPKNLYYHGAVIHDDRIVVLGGTDGSSIVNRVIAAKINANGTIGSWSNEPNLPTSLERFAAVSVRSFASDYIYVLGGIDGGGKYRNTVYHSAVPPTPTPTFTPTVTPAVIAVMDNNPGTWVGPGGQVEYTINYLGNNSDDFDRVSIVSTVPDNAELIPDSVTVNQTGVFTITGDGGPGTKIEWQWTGELPKDISDSVSYRVRRPIAPTPPVPPAISIDKSGPSAATSGELITYTLTVVNNLPIPHEDVRILDRVPTGATYVSGGDAPPEDDIVRWTLPVLGPDATAEVQFTVKAATTLVNSEYSVRSNLTTAFRGTRVVVTEIDNLPPPPGGDGIALTNQGALVHWTHEGIDYELRTNGVRNPKYDIFLPVIANR